MGDADVEIEYCVASGFLDRAVDLESLLLRTFRERLGRVSLVTGDGGAFRVRVDGETVYRESGNDRYDPDAVIRGVRSRL